MPNVDWCKVYKRLAIRLKEKLTIWPNGCVFIYEVSGSAFESSCSHENLQDSVVKPIIFTTQKMKFSVKDLFNKCKLAVLCWYVHIY